MKQTIYIVNRLKEIILYLMTLYTNLNNLILKVRLGLRF
jgi:hypothetical protein